MPAKDDSNKISVVAGLAQLFPSYSAPSQRAERTTTVCATWPPSAGLFASAHHSLQIPVNMTCTNLQQHSRQLFRANCGVWRAERLLPRMCQSAPLFPVQTPTLGEFRSAWCGHHSGINVSASNVMKMMLMHFGAKSWADTEYRECRFTLWTKIRCKKCQHSRLKKEQYRDMSLDMGEDESERGFSPSVSGRTCVKPDFYLFFAWLTDSVLCLRRSY